MAKPKRKHARASEPAPKQRAIEDAAHQIATDAAVDAALFLDAFSHLRHGHDVVAVLALRPSTEDEHHDIRQALQELDRAINGLCAAWAPLRAIVGHVVDGLSDPDVIREKAYASARRHALDKLGVDAADQRAQSRQADNSKSLRAIWMADARDRSRREEMQAATSEAIAAELRLVEQKQTALLVSIADKHPIATKFAADIVDKPIERVRQQLEAVAKPRRVTKTPP